MFFIDESRSLNFRVLVSLTLSAVLRQLRLGQVQRGCQIVQLFGREADLADRVGARVPLLECDNAGKGPHRHIFTQGCFAFVDQSDHTGIEFVFYRKHEGTVFFRWSNARAALRRLFKSAPPR